MENHATQKFSLIDFRYKMSLLGKVQPLGISILKYPFWNTKHSAISKATIQPLRSVNSRGVIGSIDDNQEECAACLKGTCRSINGFYTRPDLPPGYSLVTQIPPGACRIFIQQLKHTKNVLEKIRNWILLQNIIASEASSSFNGIQVLLKGFKLVEKASSSFNGLQAPLKGFTYFAKRTCGFFSNFYWRRRIILCELGIAKPFRFKRDFGL
ncbi:hypothetical protein NQ317_017582 [Molorchus minor]|uniref:Uncharacterized protein n=1 Tax=Molorchus minor TaxID=1323400 RepID=A0ABQ9JQZ4_9CUCU|nr:hypothetical protein NQ317_017582 [Molorchus minor]